MCADPMRLLSWNVKGHVGSALHDQVDAVGEEAPDLVCLQEVTRQSDPQWREALAEYKVESSVELLGPRTYANLVASRWPLKRLESDADDLPEPEKLLSLVVEAGRPFEVHVVHMPP